MAQIRLGVAQPHTWYGADERRNLDEAIRLSQHPPRQVVIVNRGIDPAHEANRIVADWDKYLGDAALTTAILDRLMHRSVLVEFRGKSYRLKEAASRLVKGNDSE